MSTRADEIRRRSARAAVPVRHSLPGLQFELAVTGGERWAVPTPGQGGDGLPKMPPANRPEFVALEALALGCARRVGLEVPEIGTVHTADVERLDEVFAGGPRVALAV
jgi:hypothetical protein